MYTGNSSEAISAGMFSQGSVSPGPWVCVEFGDNGDCPGWLIEKPKALKMKAKCGKGSPSLAFVAFAEEMRAQKLGDTFSPQW